MPTKDFCEKLTDMGNFQFMPQTSQDVIDATATLRARIIELQTAAEFADFGEAFGGEEESSLELPQEAARRRLSVQFVSDILSHA